MLIWIDSPQAHSSRFLLLDRDGVINEDSPDYITRWDEYRFYPDALEALRRLNDQGIRVILISNQSGLHRGIIDWDDFWEVHFRMIEGIREAGGSILATFYCPHRPEEACRCRKPLPGLILAASQVYPVPLDKTFLIGDRLTDIQAAMQAGCRAVLLNRHTGDADEGDCSSSQMEAGGVRRCTTLLEAIKSLWW